MVTKASIASFEFIVQDYCLYLFDKVFFNNQHDTENEK